MNIGTKYMKISTLAFFALLPILMFGQLTVNVTPVEPTCFGYTNGSATASATGGTAPYAYRWSNGQGGGATLMGVRAGTYTVTVTDAANRTATTVFDVTQPTQLRATFQPANGNCGAGATYIGSGGGGVAPYTYSWRNLDNGQTFAGSILTTPTRGSYHLSVTDARGCQNFSVVNVGNPLEVNVVPGDVQCGGIPTGRAQAIVSGGQPPFRYQWSTGATTEIIRNLSGGDYFVTVTDANGCQTIGLGNVKEPIPVKANLQTFDLCDNARAKISPVGGTLPHTVLWSNNGVGYSLAGWNPGTHFVLVIDAKGCKDSVSFKVGLNNNPNITVSSVNIGCGATTGSATVSVPSLTAQPVTYRWSNGATTPSVTGLAVGAYTVTITDGAGCTTVRTVNIRTVSPINFTVNSTPSQCNANTGTVSVTGVTGGTGNYTYRWSNNTIGPSIGGLAAGSYNVTVSDDGGCSTTKTVVVAPARVIEFSLNNNTPSACGGATGTSTVTNPVGGIAPYTYRWSTGATGATVTGLAPGFYSVTVVDAGGCEGKQSFTIDAVSDMVVRANITNSSCTGATGALTATVTNGRAPYTYRWNTNATTATITGLAAGNYTVTVTDANNCTQTATFRVLGMGNFNITTSKNDAACGQSNGSASVTGVTGGTGPYTFLWSNGTTTATILNIAGGTYTVTITDAAGCNGMATVVVRSVGNFNITTDIAKSDCTNPTGSIRITNVTGGTAPYTYLWSTGATTAAITNVPAGAYSVTVTDARGCSSVLSNIVVGTNSTLTATATTRNSTCGQNNGGITVSATGGTAPYTFRLPNNANINALLPGSYNVTVADAAGCSFILAGVTVRDTGSVKAQFSVAPVSCGTDSFAIRFNNNTSGMTTGATYQWTFTGSRTTTSTVQSPTVNFGGIVGEARLIATSAMGCRDTLLLRFPVENILVDLADTVLTCVSTATTLTVNNLNSATALRYRWSTGANDTLNRITVTPTASPSTYYVTLTNSAGCRKVDSAKVIIIPKTPNVADISLRQDCDTTIITFTNRAIGGNLYRWDFGDLATTRDTARGASVTYTYPRGGTYTVTIIPPLACADTFRLPINVRSGKEVQVDAGKDTTVCSLNPITLRGTSNFTSFEWGNNRNFPTILGTGQTFLARPSVVAGRDTVFYLRSRNAATGCTAIDSVIIRNAAIAVQTNRQIIACKDVNTTVTVTNLNSTLPIIARWTPSNLIVGSDSALTVVFKASANGVLIGNFRNSLGCTLTDTIRFITQEVDAKATASATVIYKDDVVVLSATPTGTGLRYSWTPNTNVSNPSNASTNATPQSTGRYTVEVTDANGCKDTAQVLITVLEPICAEPFVFIPRAFSPNMDGTNEKVFVRGDYLTENGFEFAVYNRWGELIFMTKDRKEGWDGTHRGDPVCPDVYGYYVKGVCRKNEPFFIKGNITVLK
jgi:gliding motility-associated-like protein